MKKITNHYIAKGKILVLNKNSILIEWLYCRGKKITRKASNIYIIHKKLEVTDKEDFSIYDHDKLFEGSVVFRHFYKENNNGLATTIWLYRAKGYRIEGGGE